MIELFTALNIWSPHVSSTLVIGDDSFSFKSTSLGIPASSLDFAKIHGYSQDLLMEPSKLGEHYYNAVGLIKSKKATGIGRVKLDLYINNIDASS